MKTAFVASFIAVVLVALAHAGPARNPKDDTEVVVVPMKGDFPVVAPEDVEDESSEDGFFPIIQTIPFRFSWPSLPDFHGLWQSALDLIKHAPTEGNTTSVTKVIDGHKFVINETTYTKNDTDFRSVVKISVVNVEPLESSEESTEQREPSSIATSDDGEKAVINNEIPKGKTEDIEEYSEDYIREKADLLENNGYLSRREYNSLENSVEFDDIYKPIDLSRDTYVNDLMAADQAPINPDAELIDVDLNGRPISAFVSAPHIRERFQRIVGR